MRPIFVQAETPEGNVLININSISQVVETGNDDCEIYFANETEPVRVGATFSEIRSVFSLVAGDVTGNKNNVEENK